MQNSASCSWQQSDTGTMTWAIAECDKDPTCKFIYDYGCDGTGWRYCPGLSVDENSNNNGKACSMLKKGKRLVNKLAKP